MLLYLLSFSELKLKSSSLLTFTVYSKMTVHRDLHENNLFNYVIFIEFIKNFTCIIFKQPFTYCTASFLQTLSKFIYKKLRKSMSNLIIVTVFGSGKYIIYTSEFRK